MSALSPKGLLGQAAGFDENTVEASMYTPDGSTANPLVRASGLSGTDTRLWSISQWVYIGGKPVTRTDTDYLWSAGTAGSTVQGAYLTNVTGGRGLKFFQYGGGATRGLTDSDGLIIDQGWYHFLFVWDTDNATANERMKMYVNGVDQGAPTTAVDASYLDSYWNTTAQHVLCQDNFSTVSNSFDGYTAQFLFCEGVALTPSDVLETSYAYGINGTGIAPKTDAEIVALADLHGGTSHALTSGIAAGTDASAQGLDYSAAAGITTSSQNTPSRTYATLDGRVNTDSAITYSQGNQRWAIGGADGSVCSTLGMTTGKWVCEYVPNNTNDHNFGICSEFVKSARLNNSIAAITGGAYTYRNNGNKTINGTITSYGATYTTNDVIRCEFDADALEIEFFKNGVSQGTISVSETDETWFFWANSSSGSTDGTFRFDDNLFTGTPTADFLPLKWSNYETPTGQGADNFSTDLWAGNGPTGQTIDTGLDTVDVTWVKDRTGTSNHSKHDKVRGSALRLSPDVTNAEDNQAASFPGYSGTTFSVDDDGVSTAYNTSGRNYAGWSWKANGAGASNTDGTITTTVSVAAAGHYSVIGYQGNTVAGATIGHGLPGAPDFFVTKSRDNGARGWIVQERPIFGGTHFSRLETNAAPAANSTLWNNTTMGASVVTLGNSAETNSTDNFIAYAFRSVPGVCRVHWYDSVGNTDGNFVWCGFRPRWIMIRYYGGTGGLNWNIYDTERMPLLQSNGIYLLADQTNAELTASNMRLDIFHDGFKPRVTNSQIGGNADYLFIAMADIAGGGDLPPITARG